MHITWLFRDKLRGAGGGPHLKECKTQFLASYIYQSKINKINNSFYLVQFAFSLFWKINKHNQLSTFFKICTWIVRAKAAINLILRYWVCFNRTQKSYTALTSWYNINKYVHLLSVNKHIVRDNAKLVPDALSMFNKQIHVPSRVRDKSIPYHIHELFSTSKVMYLYNFIENVDCKRSSNSLPHSLTSIFNKHIINLPLLKNRLQDMRQFLTTVIN